MTDREKLLKLLDTCKMDSMSAILDCYFDVYYDDYTASQIHGFIKNLNMYLGYKVENLDRAKYIAYERASYLKTYLSGDMWTTEEAARENLQPQIDNAQAIIDVCKR